MDKEYFFEKADTNDAADIARLYQSVLGTPFCTWDESYPSNEQISADMDAGTLYVLRYSGEIIGAISIAPQNELDHLVLWENSHAREIARVVISPRCQGKSLALRMVLAAEDILKNNGYQAVHLLAALQNTPACKTYLKAGYSKRGTVFMYGNYYYAMEKALL